MQPLSFGDLASDPHPPLDAFALALAAEFGDVACDHRPVQYGSPAPFIAFAVAMVAGALLANGAYLGGGMAAAVAVVVLGLWRFARARGDDDRHTLW